MVADALASFCPFIVFGASKSGTTWLQKICDAHPDVRCHFQRQIFPWHRRLRQKHLPHGGIVLDRDRSPFGGVFADEQSEKAYFWEERFLMDLPFLQADFVERYLDKVVPREQLRHLEQLHRTMLRGVVASLLCDVEGKVIYGTKSHTDLDLFFELYPKAKVLHIVRDGRDVVVSKRFHAIRRGTYFHGDERARALYMLGESPLGRRVISFAGRRLPIDDDKWFRTSPDDPAHFLTPQVIEKFAGDWNAYVSYGLDFQDRYPDNFLTLRYEDLKVDGAAACRRAFDFLEVDATEETIRGVLEATDFRVLKKNVKNGQSSFFRAGKKGGWAEHFSDESLAHFMRIAGASMRRLGYLDDEAPAAHREQPTA